MKKLEAIQNIIHTACMEYHTNYDEYSQVPTQLWKFLDRYGKDINSYYKSKVPKKILAPEFPVDKYIGGWANGYNQAIADFHKDSLI